jgi:hypothetical protein
MIQSCVLELDSGLLEKLVRDVDLVDEEKERLAVCSLTLEKDLGCRQLTLKGTMSLMMLDVAHLKCLEPQSVRRVTGRN